MQRHMLKSKIHRATVTACDLNYAGSITIDAKLMSQADLLPNELVHVLNVDNGHRFETYVIEGRPGSGALEVNGAAARLAHQGTYAEDELDDHRPRVVHVNAANEVLTVNREAAMAAG
ncbi:hypothetical protein LCGC14_2658000 [marine sediment metagenome]|uniref:Aspartate 1-decarboxylase n=1 Tax=marine sediment metagenome TaxID=412755 RepID=A0A0F9AF64_9ZZZZ